MKIEKDKRSVFIVCSQDTVITGRVHLNPGERTIDFLNNTRDSFIAVTEAKVHNAGRFKLSSNVLKRGRTLLLSKNAIKWIEES
ncbi:MAG: hypothetical protein PHG40_02060 [Candidatus Omnitrophica bacterium]|nr:hypothetical protein [Candidatus Omnitrophota bacterium]